MKQIIRTESCILREGEQVPVGSLTETDRRELSRWLRMTWLTELCRGRAEINWRQKKDPVK